MDAKEYDRIADLLMQIRMKYTKLGKSIDERVVVIRGKPHNVLDLISLLLVLNDGLANLDDKGWL